MNLHKSNLEQLAATISQTPTVFGPRQPRPGHRVPWRMPKWSPAQLQHSRKTYRLNAANRQRSVAYQILISSGDTSQLLAALLCLRAIASDLTVPRDWRQNAEMSFTEAVHERLGGPGVA